MKTRVRLGILAIYLACAAAAAAQAPPAPAAGEVHVTTYILGTKTPIPGAQASVWPSGDCGDCLIDLPDDEQDLLEYLTHLAAARGLVVGSELKRSITGFPPSKLIGVTADRNGTVLFRDVPLGKHEVSAKASGYVGNSLKARSGNAVVLEASSVVTLDEAHRSVEVTLFLQPFPTVAGRILDKDGNPAANVEVVLSFVNRASGQRLVSRDASTRTNAAGEYALTALTLGEFVLAPAGLDPDKATPLVLDAGQKLTGVDFQLQ